MRHMLNFGFTTEFELNEQEVLVLNEDSCSLDPHQLEIHSIPSMQRLCERCFNSYVTFVCFCR